MFHHNIKKTFNFTHPVIVIVKMMTIEAMVMSVNNIITIIIIIILCLKTTRTFVDLHNVVTAPHKLHAREVVSPATHNTIITDTEEVSLQTKE